MPPSFSGLTNDLSLLTSETLEIVAESGKKRFYVHSDILVAHSTPTRTMSDIAEKKIDFSSWDGDTVGRFAQFLYVGDYQVPEPTPEEEDIEERPVGRDGADTPDTIQSLADQEKSGPKDTNLLLVHARVYMLANDNNAEALREMAFGRLRTALGGIDKHTLTGASKVTTDVINLLGYIYSCKHTGGGIRDLVSKFVAENIEKLVKRCGMVLLLDKGGDLAVDLMTEVSGRICNMGKDIESWRNRAAESDEKARQSEAESTEKMQQLEVKTQELEAKVQQAEIASVEKVRELELTKMKGLEIKVKDLEAKVQCLDTKLQGHTGAANPKLKTLEANVKRLFHYVGWVWNMG